jgi:hypothetical protein
MGLLDSLKGLFQQRGGADAAKEDAQELKDVAQSDASTTDKAKEGAEAIKDPGAQGPAAEGPGAEERGAKGPGAEERGGTGPGQ